MKASDIVHISEKPWSDYTEADYTIEQWHNACLIHLHTGPPTSKSQCKLPVKTPNGALNRNGVHAAAAALAGARAPLKAPPEQKSKAAAALRRYYSQLGETPPDSLAVHSTDHIVEDILSHHGVKGMKWGVRRSADSSGSHPLAQVRSQTVRSIQTRRAQARSPEVTVRDTGKKLRTSGGKGLPAHPDAVRARTIGQKGKASGLKSLSDKELKDYANRLQLEANVNRLNVNEMGPGRKFVANLLGQTGKNQANNVANDVATVAVKKHVTSRILKAAALAAA